MNEQGRLGAFRLAEPIGRGGMGVIHEAVHEPSGSAVAVKVLTANRPASTELAEAFQREVHSIAKLRHPAIVTPLDAGIAAADHPHYPGRPWLAMELIHGDSISRARPRHFSKLRRMLEALLDALAHAHARGVIHRDIKPANVLRTPGDPPLRLVDFGIARLARDLEASGAQRRRGRVTGTPNYMAPEQILGAFRDEGPWTDLYSVGCLAWALVCDRAPFEADETEHILAAQVREPPPHFAPVMEVPDGFELWLRRLLAKSPERRMRRAADAAHMLRQFPEVRPEAFATGEQFGAGEPPTLAFLGRTQTSIEAASSTGPDEPTVASGQAAALAVQDALLPDIGLSELGRLRPPTPADWRAPDQRQTIPDHLVGAGLGLFGVRAVGVVGRLATRDRLWQALREAAHTRTARVVLVDGGAGTGKTALLGWLAQRAHETGAATTLWASHTAAGGPLDGIGPMLARHFGCLGLDRPAIGERLEHLLRRLRPDVEALETSVLAELIAPERVGGDQEAGFAFGSSQERVLTARRVLDAIAEERPLVVCLDDAHFGPETLLLVEQLLARPEGLPAVVAIGVRREAAPAGAAESLARLAEACGPPLQLEPLGPRDMRELVEHTLSLEQSAVARVVEHAQGHPLFALQLLEQWVEQGELEPGPRGFRLRDGAAAVPADLRQMWRGRLGAMLESLPPPRRADGRDALELAAALGGSVDGAEWSSACRHAGLEPPSDLVGLLARRGFIRQTDNGWAIAHASLRATLEAQARQGGRWARHHAACLDMLEAFYGAEAATGAAVGHRWAEHLAGCGRLDEAVDVLLESARDGVIAGANGRALVLVERREAWLDALDAPHEDRRRVAGKVLEGFARSVLGQVDHALAIVEPLEDLARARGWDDELGEVLRLRGRERLFAGEPAEARRLLADARACFERIGDLRRVGICHQLLGQCYYLMGELDPSEMHLREAARLLRTHGRPAIYAQCISFLASVLGYQGQLAEAGQLAEEGVQVARAQGNLPLEGLCLNELAEFARRNGELTEAAMYLRRAIRLFDAVGNVNAYIARVNLGFVAIEQRDHEAARPLFERVVAEAEPAGMAYLVDFAALGLCCCEAAEGAWLRCRERLDATCERLASSALAERDLLMLARHLTELCEAAGHDELAVQARALADDQAARLEGE